MNLRRQWIDLHRAQHGQALIEFLTMGSAIIAFLLLIPVVGKYQDVSHATQMASRYLAFDAAVKAAGGDLRLPDSDIESEARRRLFSESSAPIKTGDVAGEFAAHRNALWTLPNGQPLIASKSDIRLQQGASKDPSSSSFLLHSRKGLNDSGLVTAVVRVPLVNMPQGIQTFEPLSSLNLNMERRMVMLVSPWTSANYATTNAGVDGATRESVLAVKSLSAPLLIPFALRMDLQVRPPKIGELSRWQELVPADRQR